MIRPAKLTARQTVERHLRERFGARHNVRYTVLLNHARAVAQRKRGRVGLSGDYGLFEGPYAVPR